MTLFIVSVSFSNITFHKSPSQLPFFRRMIFTMITKSSLFSCLLSLRRNNHHTHSSSIIKCSFLILARSALPTWFSFNNNLNVLISTFLTAVVIISPTTGFYITIISPGGARFRKTRRTIIAAHITAGKFELPAIIPSRCWKQWSLKH